MVTYEHLKLGVGNPSTARRAVPLPLQARGGVISRYIILQSSSPPRLRAYPYTQVGSEILNHPLALEVAESTEWILGEMQCAGSLAFFWLCALEIPHLPGERVVKTAAD